MGFRLFNHLLYSLFLWLLHFFIPLVTHILSLAHLRDNRTRLKLLSYALEIFLLKNLYASSGLLKLYKSLHQWRSEGGAGGAGRTPRHLPGAAKRAKNVKKKSCITSDFISSTRRTDKIWSYIWIFIQFSSIRRPRYQKNSLRYKRPYWNSKCKVRHPIQNFASFWSQILIHSKAANAKSFTLWQTQGTVMDWRFAEILQTMAVVLRIFLTTLLFVASCKRAHSLFSCAVRRPMLCKILGWSVMRMDSGQRAEWIEVKLGTKLGVRQGHVLRGDPVPKVCQAQWKLQALGQ